MLFNVIFRGASELLGKQLQILLQLHRKCDVVDDEDLCKEKRHLTVIHQQQSQMQ